jgi:hypothetical protein
MGVVDEAEQISLGRRVALRILPGPASGDRVVSRSGWETIAALPMRASVGSTEASASLPARVGVVGPKRAVEARTDKRAQPEAPGEGAQPGISDTDGFVTECS